MQTPFRCVLSLVLASLVLGPFAVAAQPAQPFELREGDRVVFLGDTFIEREQYYGWIEIFYNRERLHSASATNPLWTSKPNSTKQFQPGGTHAASTISKQGQH